MKINKYSPGLNTLQKAKVKDPKVLSDDPLHGTKLDGILNGPRDNAVS